MDDVFRLSVAEASDLFAESAFASSRLARIKAPHVNPGSPRWGHCLALILYKLSVPWIAYQ